jgi:hypothetical protein
MLILHDSLMLMLVWVGVMLMLIVVDPISISRRVSHSPSRVKEEKSCRKARLSVFLLWCCQKCFQKDDFFQHNCSGSRESSASKHCECSSATDASLVIRILVLHPPVIKPRPMADQYVGAEHISDPTVWLSTFRTHFEQWGWA